MSLFANQHEASVASTVALVEQTLAELGHRPAASQVSDPDASHAWRIVTGSATTLVTVVHRAAPLGAGEGAAPDRAGPLGYRNAFPHLRVCAVVMTIDDAVDRAALFAHLLDLNARLCGAAFALAGDQVLLVSERPTLDLDRSEVHDIIARVTGGADDHDDELVARFGGRLGA